MRIRSRPARVPMVIGVLALTAAGCGGPQAVPSGVATATTTGAATATAPAAASPAPRTPVTMRNAPPAKTQAPPPAARPDGGVTGLPWPAATAAGAADLQRAVDGGAQPWLLDPAEVARSYATFRGWTGVQVTGRGDATPARVTVRSSAGVHDLTLTQPGRRGAGGIWLVTADSAA